MDIKNKIIMESFSFISTSDAAAITGVTKETIRNLCKKGTIRYQQKGNMYYPCKEDIIQCKKKIYCIHSLKADITRLKYQLEKERRKLLTKKEECKKMLNERNISPTQILRIEKLAYALLRFYIKENHENLNEREIKLLFMMLRGDYTPNIAKKFKISDARVGQIWNQILRKIASTKNALIQKDEEISNLRQKLQDVEDKISFDSFEAVSKKPLVNFDLLFGSLETCGFTPRIVNGLHVANIKNIYDLVNYQRRDIELIPHIGKKSLNEIDTWLETHGLDYGMQGINLAELEKSKNI